MTLSATPICREALSAFLTFRRGAVSALPSNSFEIKPVEGLFGLIVFIPDDDLEMSIEDFTDKHVHPVMKAWAPLFAKVDLDDRLLLLPEGVLSRANEMWRGTSMRCLIIRDTPTDNYDVPSRLTRYYDVAVDDFVEGECSMSVSFWVHTADTKANLAEAV
jgi:hypothetical protein